MSNPHNCTRAAPAALLALTLTSLSASDLSDRVGFFRQTEIRVPHSAARFKADGRVTAEERSACAVTRQFITFEQDARGDGRTTAYLAHTGSCFYVAFTATLPEGEVPRAQAVKRDGTALWKKDDAIELMITVGARSLDFIGNSEGLCGDYASRPKDMAWSHDGWQYAARRTPTGWAGEFLLSAEVFGIAAFTPTTVCQMDVVNNAKSSYLSGLAYRGGAWHANKEYYPRIRFGVPGQIYRGGSEVGVLQKGRIGLKTKLVNPSSVKKTVNIWAAFYRVKANKSVSYYEAVSGLYNTGGIALLPGATDEQLIRHVLTPILKDYVRGGVIDEVAEIGGGATKAIDLWRHSFPGTYLMAELVRDADTGEVICGGVFPLTVAPPLKTDLEYYYLTAKRIYALTLLPSDPSIVRVRYTVTSAKNKEKVSETVADVAATGQRLKTAISSADWPAGKWQMTVEALNAGGEVVSRSSLQFEKPRTPVWFNSDAGRLIEVSYPWTPAEATNTHVKVYGRRYDWGDGPFIKKIVSKGRDILVAPVRMPVTVNGKAESWTNARHVLKRTDTAKAVYRTQASAGPLGLVATTTVEFDGMCRFDMTLSAKSPVTVNQMFLDIPVRREVARLFSRYSLGCMPSNEMPKEWAACPRSGLVPKQTMSFPFTPSIVLRNDDVGIEWFAEWDWGWSSQDKSERIEIVPRNDATLLRVRFIDKPVRIDKPRTITFGLQTWPIKPWPEEELNTSNYLVSIPKRKSGPQPFNRSLGATPEEFARNLRQSKGLGMGVMWIFHWNAYRSPDGPIRHPPEYPILLNAEVEKRVKTYVEVTQSVGLPVIGHAGYALPPTVPVFEHYGKEMAVHPIINKGTWGYKFTAHSPFADAWVHGFKQLAEKYHWSGVQLDGAFSPRYNECEETGCGVRDEHGKLRGRYPIFAYRDFARRLYNVYHGEVLFPKIRHGFVYCHLGGHTMGAIHGFCDTIHSGEDRSTMLVKHLREIDLDRARAAYASGAFGVPRHLLAKMPKAPVGPLGRLAWAVQLDMTMAHNRILNWTQRENYNGSSFPAHRLWLARKWVGARPDNYVWHDESNQYLTMNQRNMYASFYLQRGRHMLLGVSNWGENAGTVDVRLRLDKLGFKGKSLMGEDAITRKRVAIRSGMLPLQVNGDAFRLIKIYAEE